MNTADLFFRDYERHKTVSHLKMPWYLFMTIKPYKFEQIKIIYFLLTVHKSIICKFRQPEPK